MQFPHEKQHCSINGRSTDSIQFVDHPSDRLGARDPIGRVQAVARCKREELLRALYWLLWSHRMAQIRMYFLSPASHAFGSLVRTLMRLPRFASNQSRRRTADRSDASRKIMKAHSMHFTLASASGR